MLIGINPILSPEMLKTMRSMGHGDKIALVDSNFPSNSLNSLSNVPPVANNLIYFIINN